MRFKLVCVSLIVSSILVACAASTPIATAPAPQPTLVPPTQPSYPGGTPPIPTALPLGYPGSAPIVVVYRDYEIIPATLAIVAGTPIQFAMSSDNVASHQPYSDSASNPFEAPTELKSSETFEFTFTEPGTVTLLCQVHLEMRATLTVVQP